MTSTANHEMASPIIRYSESELEATGFDLPPSSYAPISVIEEKTLQIQSQQDNLNRKQRKSKPKQNAASASQFVAERKLVVDEVKTCFFMPEFGHYLANLMPKLWTAFVTDMFTSTSLGLLDVLHKGYNPEMTKAFNEYSIGIGKLSYIAERSDEILTDSFISDLMFTFVMQCLISARRVDVLCNAVCRDFVSNNPMARTMLIIHMLQGGNLRMFKYLLPYDVDQLIPEKQLAILINSPDYGDYDDISTDFNRNLEAVPSLAHDYMTNYINNNRTATHVTGPTASSKLLQTILCASAVQTTGQRYRLYEKVFNSIHSDQNCVMMAGRLLSQPRPKNNVFEPYKSRPCHEDVYREFCCWVDAFDAKYEYVDDYIINSYRDYDGRVNGGTKDYVESYGQICESFKQPFAIIKFDPLYIPRYNHLEKLWLFRDYYKLSVEEWFNMFHRAIHCDGVDRREHLFANYDEKHWDFLHFFMTVSDVERLRKSLTPKS